jgi:hypothetical protein
MIDPAEASDVVAKCIKAISGVALVDAIRSLGDNEIRDETLNNLIDLLENNNTIGLPSKGRQIADSAFHNVDTDTIVNDLIDLVTTNAF